MIKFVEVKKIKKHSNSSVVDGIYFTHNMYDYFKLNGDYAFTQGGNDVYDGDLGESIFNFDKFDSMDKKDIVKDWYRFIARRFKIMHWDNTKGIITQYITNNFSNITDFDKLIKAVDDIKYKYVLRSKVRDVPCIKYTLKADLNTILKRECKQIESRIQRSVDNTLVMDDSYLNNILAEISYTYDEIMDDPDLVSYSKLTNYINKRGSEDSDYNFCQELLKHIDEAAQFGLTSALKIDIINSMI